MFPWVVQRINPQCKTRGGEAVGLRALHPKSEMAREGRGCEPRGQPDSLPEPRRDGAGVGAAGERAGSAWPPTQAPGVDGLAVAAGQGPEPAQGGSLRKPEEAQDEGRER